MKLLGYEESFDFAFYVSFALIFCEALFWIRRERHLLDSRASPRRAMRRECRIASSCMIALLHRHKLIF